MVSEQPTDGDMFEAHRVVMTAGELQESARYRNTAKPIGRLTTMLCKKVSNISEIPTINKKAATNFLLSFIESTPDDIAKTVQWLGGNHTPHLNKQSE